MIFNLYDMLYIIYYFRVLKTNKEKWSLVKINHLDQTVQWWMFIIKGQEDLLWQPEDVQRSMLPFKGHIINKFLLQSPFLQQICMNCLVFMTLSGDNNQFETEARITRSSTCSRTILLSGFILLPHHWMKEEVEKC